jgi:hypothetical protein
MNVSPFGVDETMKVIRPRISVVIFLTTIAVAGSVSGATIARFDLGQTAATGYELISTSSLTATQNGVTLTAAGSGLSSRQRSGAPADVELNVASDFIFNNSTITFTFAGLAQNTDYEFKTTAYDNTGGGAEYGKWYVGSVAPANLQHTWVNDSDSTSPFTLSGTSDGSGSLQIIVDGEGQNNRANGFEVVVPEPASLALAGFGLVGVIGCRRRRK